MMYAYSITTKRSAVHGRPWRVVVAVVALAVVMSGQRAQAQPGTVLSHQKISSTTGGGPRLSNSDWFGSGTASLGDLDGDDVGDLAVGVWRDDDGGDDRGAVFILFLNADGTVKSHHKISDTSGDLPPGALDNGDQFGVRVASLGDLDGDGVTDLAVGAWKDDDGGLDRGAVWILFLNDNGTVKDHQKISSTAGGFTGILDDGDQFGISVASLGDLNGDRVGDLAVGAAGDDDAFLRGAVWILFLNPDGTVKCMCDDGYQKISPTEGGGPPLDDADAFGVSVGSLGDLDADGPSVLALAVGALGDGDGGSTRGAVWILFLNPDGTVKSDQTQKISDTAGGFTGILDDFDRFGVSVASLGDLDGDRVTDLAVAAHFDDDGGPCCNSNRGAVWILFLNDNGTVKDHQKISSTQGGFTGTLDVDERFGMSVASLGDLDGDGVGDLAVGAVFDDDGGFNRGAVWILFLDGICLWDLDASGSVGASDLLALLASWGPCPPKADCPADFDDNDNVGASDLLALLANWGPCP